MSTGSSRRELQPGYATLLKLCLARLLFVLVHVDLHGEQSVQRAGLEQAVHIAVTAAAPCATQWQVNADVQLEHQESTARTVSPPISTRASFCYSFALMW